MRMKAKLIYNNKKIVVMGRLTAITLIVLGLCCFGCNRETKTMSNNVEVQRDTIYVPVVEHGAIILVDTVFFKDEEVTISHILRPPMLDSLETKKVLETALWSGNVDPGTKDGCTPELFLRDDLAYLPYLFLEETNCTNSYSGKLFPVFTVMCSEAIDDKKLFETGKCMVDQANERDKLLPPKVHPITGKIRKISPIQYPDTFKSGLTFSYINAMPFNITVIDSLRVRAIVHNDRKALKKLEDYYKKKGDDTGIAIYYKVMLCYEGNGDLAEKFYRVLEPHFNETPEFRKAVREVLLRAAHCDNDRRAQELCDSLGFSLCDYRLPLPTDIDAKE